MRHLIKRWLKKYFSDPEGGILAILLLVGFAIVIYMGDILLPVLISLVIAYLLEGVVQSLGSTGLSRKVSVILVYIGFLVFFSLLLSLLPLLSTQVSELIKQFPEMMGSGQKILAGLPNLYPNFITQTEVDALLDAIKDSVSDLGKHVLSFSLSSLTGVFTVLLYIVLLPVLVFFFLKDKELLVSWVSSCMPQERGVATRVWQEMDCQIGNYVRGKFVEILIVGTVTYVAFVVMNLKFAMLLAFLVGFSVLIPFIGATAVTIPVLLIAYFQWGLGSQFVYVALVYTVIQALDGNVLVPLLFSEAVNLHPIAIITAVLFFGGIWGFWGVFFAIPLATLVMAVIHAWPRSGGLQEATEEGLS